MKNRTVYITNHDMKRLRALLDAVKEVNSQRSNELQALESELERGQVIASNQVPDDVITMNSTVCLVDLDTGEEEIYTLAFPGDADIDQNKISVLAPIGTAMLGYRVGDTLEWEVPAGLRRLKVKDILYQPEAAGEDETEIVNFMPPDKEKWLDTMKRLAKLQAVPDDYGSP